MSHFNMLVFPAILLPLSEYLNMNMPNVLSLSFPMYLLFGVTALPWGLATDRWGVKRFMTIFYAGATFFGFVTFFALNTPSLLMVSLAGIGLFSGIYHPAGLGWISRDIKRVSYGMGINGMFGNLGLAVAPLAAGAINNFYGPKGVYFLVGLMNLTGFILILLFSESGSEAKEKIKSMPVAENGGFDKAFIILLGAMMLGGIAYRGATVSIPAYFELKNMQIFDWLATKTEGGVSKNFVATTSTSFIFILGMIGQYTGGRAAEKIDLKLGYLFFHCAAAPAAFLMSWLANIPLVLVTGVYLFFLLGMQPIENTLVARFTPKKFHSSAFGTKFILTFGVGSVAVKMVELIEKARGIESVFLVLGLLSVALVGVILIMIRFVSARTAQAGG
jgi:MFS family permease